MAAGDKTRILEGSGTGYNFELWQVQSNGTTNVVITTKLKRATAAFVTFAEAVGATAITAQAGVDPTTKNAVNVNCNAALADKKMFVLILGLV